MEKGQRNGTDTLQTDNVFTRKEYIEREAVLAMKKPFPTSKDSVTLYQQYFISPSAVEKIPAADVVPVRHGRWKKSYADHEAFGVRPFFRYCSECHEATVHQYNYCPNCGARMDGDGE